MSDSWEAPNRIDVVQRVNADNPGLIHNSHAFTERVVCELKKTDPKWGRNGKRGNVHDLSDDVAAWVNPAVPWGCSIVDIIGGAGGPSPSPAWIDQTRRTAEGGTVGAWVDVQCGTTPTPDPGPGPTPDPPPVLPPAVDTALLRQIDEKLDRVLAGQEAAEKQQADDTATIGRWLVEQSQGVIDSIVGQLGPKIDRITCRFRLALRGEE